MSAFNLTAAFGEDWRGAVARCAAGVKGIEPAPNLGFVYATDHLAPQLGPIVDALVRQTGVMNWVGSVGIGVCATGVECFDEPGIVLMTGGLAGDLGLIAALQDALDADTRRPTSIEVVSHPLSIFAGAIGAAIWGAFRHQRLDLKEAAWTRQTNATALPAS